MIATIKMLSNRILKIWNRCGNKRFYQFWHAFWMEIFHRLHDRVYTINRVILAKDWSKMTDQAYCQAVADISQNISNGYQTSADSTVRVLSLSRFLRIFRKIVSHGCSLSGFSLSVRPEKYETELSGLSPSLSAYVWWIQ